MNLTVSRITPREAGDPEYVDYWILLEHVSEVSWEVPVSKVELENLQPWLPRQLRTSEKKEN